jgi:predicted ABC-type ATPase
MTASPTTEPVTQEQAEQIPQNLYPYAAALLLAYMATNDEQQDRRSRLFAQALAASATSVFGVMARGLNYRSAAKPFADTAAEAVSQFRENHPEATEVEISKFVDAAAATLATGAGSRTTLEVLRTLDPEGANFKKMWLTRGDAKVRESHRLLHGQTASVGDSFKPGLSYPGDPSAPLDERINCRCFLWAVPNAGVTDEDIARAFEPADLEMAFAASAAITAASMRNTLRHLMRVAPWTWQPRDSIGRWVEVNDVLHVPSRTGRGKERVRVTDITGRNKIEVESLRFPDRRWEMDSRDAVPDFAKAELPGRERSMRAPNIPTRDMRELPVSQFVEGPIDRTRPYREVRPSLIGDESIGVGVPFFSADEIPVGDVVVVESKSRPGQFRYMVVDDVDLDANTATLLYPPEPGEMFTGESGERIFQLRQANAQQLVNVGDGVVYEAADPALVEETIARFESSRFGFANPRWFSGTDDAFKEGYERTDWAPERKELHDRIVQDAFDRALPAQGSAKFYMMGGGPSSGKSTMLLADTVDVPLGENAIQINADDIKEFLPEYVGLKEADIRSASTFVHKESSEISSRMIREAPEDKHVVLDGVGDKGAHEVMNRLRTAKSRGQRTVANYATLPTDMAVMLSNKRGEETGRYVPEDYIRRAHADVTDTFFDLAKMNALDELYLWNTEQWDDVRKVGIPRLIYSQVDGRAVIHDEALLLEFLSKSRTRRHSIESIIGLTQLPEALPPIAEFPEFPPPTGILPEVTGVPGEAPAGLAAAANFYDSLDWNTLEQALIEVGAELRGAKFASKLPTDDPQIELLKTNLKDEFSDPAKQIVVISNP